MNEFERRKNNNLFIGGLISLILALGLMGFAVYILPFLIWNLGYDVPEFVSTFREWLRDSYSYSKSMSTWFIFFLFFIPGAISAIITYVLTRLLDRNGETETDKTDSEIVSFDEGSNESVGLALKVLALVGLVIAAVFFAEWFFSATL